MNATASDICLALLLGIALNLALVAIRVMFYRQLLAASPVSFRALGTSNS